MGYLPFLNDFIVNLCLGLITVVVNGIVLKSEIENFFANSSAVRPVSLKGLFSVATAT